MDSSHPRKTRRRRTRLRSCICRASQREGFMGRCTSMYCIRSNRPCGSGKRQPRTLREGKLVGSGQSYLCLHMSRFLSRIAVNPPVQLPDVAETGSVLPGCLCGTGGRPDLSTACSWLLLCYLRCWHISGALREQPGRCFGVAYPIFARPGLELVSERRN